MLTLRWRHTIRMALLLCIPCLLVACQGVASPAPTTSSPSQRLLTLWHALPPKQARVLQDIADEWALRQGPDVRVRLERSPNEETLHQKLLAAIQTEMPPTLALVRPPDIATYVEADVLLPLDTLLEEESGEAVGDEDYYMHFFDSLRYPEAQNALYAWPVHRYQTLLFMNRTRVTELGGELPLDSWEEFVQLCAAHREAGGENCLAAFPTGSVALLWLWSHGGEVVDESGQEPAFLGEAGESAMRWLAALRAVDGLHQVPTHDAKVDAFVSSNTLFTFDSTAAIPMYQARINSAFDMAVIPPPSTNGEPVTLATGGNVAIFHSDPEMQEMAKDFLRFWTSTESNYRWAEALDAYPVRRSAMERLIAQWPKSSSLRQASEWLPFSRSKPLLAKLPEVEQALAEAMLSTINGQSTPQEALEEAVQRTQGLLQP